MDGLPAGLGTNRPQIPRLVSHIGRDLLDPYIDKPELASKISTKRTAIKKLLLDQTVVSGIGNIYADEALFEAEINPFRPAASLSSAQVERLLMCTQDVLERALAAGGTSFDALYVHINGESGYFDRSLRAYGRSGTPCPRCGAVFTKVMAGGRSSTFCPVCQQS